MPTSDSRTLVLARLTVRSTYAAHSEEPAAGDAFDTIQFWLGPEDGWRIRTFAVNHDLHIHHLADFAEDSGDRLQILRDHLQRMYQDVLAQVYVLELKNAADEVEVTRVLEANGLTGVLEYVEAGFAFYNPDRGEYRTQTDSL
jgi:hypothetical protein